MKKLLFCLFIFFQSVDAFAGHIAGGEIFYTYIGAGTNAGTSRYRITVRLFRECNPVTIPGGPGIAPIPGSVPVNIYNNTSPSTQFGSQIQVQRVSLDANNFRITAQNPCITGVTDVCYQVATYETTQDLPNSANGYIAAFQTCCRTNLIANVAVQPLPGGGSGEGATYTCVIPGTSALATGNNSSAVFALKDTTLVCKLSPFILDFSATDADNDSLSYSFCDAYDRGNTVNSGSTDYSFPPFNNVTYTGGYSGAQPLGPNVRINPTTGIISGTAPDVGSYVVNVCIIEWRNGVAISQHRKDFTLKVTDCTLTGAELKPSYITCDGFSLTFQNESTNSSISSYLWNFGERNVVDSVSTNPTPTHTYRDTGVYTLTLRVASVGGCLDSATAKVNIFPGFVPAFNITGNCFQSTYTFRDATLSQYGVVNSWRWDLGDTNTSADTARGRDTAWKYSAPINTQVSLIVTNSKGCIDTLVKPLLVTDKPSLGLAFKDTLICNIDTLALRANITSGSVTWVPDNLANRSRILNASTTTPLVYPRDTTSYVVTVNDNGCINSDTVRVNVLPFITVDAGLDSGICRSDRFTLSPVSQALSYRWTASTGEVVPASKYPFVQPLTTTMYYVTANLGRCQDRDSVRIFVTPFPVAVASNDTVVCFGDRTTLRGNIVGSAFSWSPTASLTGANTLNPIAGPSRTTQYILTVRDTLGCSSAVSDTILVTVIPPQVANAGRDTAVLANQPLQLLATGGTTYAWRPVTGLNNPSIANPIATLPAGMDSIRYTVRATNAGGCFAEDNVLVRVYKTGPDIFVPTGFTPNGDGRNDVLTPVTIGITRLLYFRVFNRWGQLLFITTDPGKGWDGTFNGVKQGSGTYVFEASGTDFLGTAVYRKGTCVLIR